MAIFDLLPTADREGENTSVAFWVPTNISKYSILTALLNILDLEDETLSFSLNLYISDDGIKWKSRAGMTCIGGKLGWNAPPSLGIPSEDLKGHYMQIKLTTNKNVNIGIEMEDKEKTSIVSG